MHGPHTPLLSRWSSMKSSGLMISVCIVTTIRQHSVHRMPISSLFCLTWRRRSRLAPSVRVSTKIETISDPFPPSFLTQFRHSSADFRYAWNNLTGVNLESEDWLKLQAHFLSGNDDRAMDLLRREWGHMLNTNLSVQLTLLEGFTANGSLGYVYIVLYYEYTD